MYPPNSSRQRNKKLMTIVHCICKGEASVVRWRKGRRGGVAVVMVWE